MRGRQKQISAVYDLRSYLQVNYGVPLTTLMILVTLEHGSNSIDLIRQHFETKQGSHKEWPVAHMYTCK